MDSIEKELFEMSDLTNLEFHKKTINDDTRKYIGIKIPTLRKYAKILARQYELEYLLKNIKEDYYEEVLLKAILIGEYKKLKWQELEKHIRFYVPKITNWSLCDTLCSSLKITKQYKKEMWKLIQEYLKSSKEFEVRFALVMLLNYYLDDEHIEEIYKIINQVNVDKYYVKMANAWLISYCVIKYYDRTTDFLKKEYKNDEWTQNKAIQKLIESFRLTKEQKETLKLNFRKEY